MEKNTSLSEELKEFKAGLEKIRKEEILAGEAIDKAKASSKEIISQELKKIEALIEKKRLELKEKRETLFKKMREEGEKEALEFIKKGKARKERLKEKASGNLNRAVEFVINKLME